MICNCDINPDKCIGDCSHFTKDSNCNNCKLIHKCICVKLRDLPPKYKDDQNYCRADKHECREDEFCISMECECGNEEGVEIVDDEPVNNFNNICFLPGCSKPASLIKCPVCTEWGLPEHAYCSFNHFRDAWKEHSIFHKRYKEIHERNNLGIA